MTREQAEQIFYIKREINTLESEIRDLEKNRSYLRGVMYDDMPKAPGPSDGMSKSDKYLDEYKTLLDILKYTKEQLLRRILDFNRFLITIDDAELRTIIRLRCVDCKTWQEIGDELHMDRRTASRKYDKFFDEIECCPQCPSDMLYDVK